mmetsp:Transcript_38808/g.123218  ORF Transcript_38808/g.123218 Transcript_38808/m.123218 type:complete len:154 (-) Transcript_38808:24-485(-)
MHPAWAETQEELAVNHSTSGLSFREIVFGRSGSCKSCGSAETMPSLFSSTSNLDKLLPLLGLARLPETDKGHFSVAERYDDSGALKWPDPSSPLGIADKVHEDEDEWRVDDDLEDSAGSTLNSASSKGGTLGPWLIVHLACWLGSGFAGGWRG